MGEKVRKITMQTLALTSTAEEAHLLRTFLESRDVEAYLFDENIVQLMWHYTIALGGIRVMVADEDDEDATEAYEEYQGALRAEPTTYSVVRFWPLVLLGYVLFHVPLLIFGRKFYHKEKAES